ncbi:succinate semialdehyde dehydrogenase [Fodinibius roseus]|uniref:Succinate semialdehyde dehydrogenase n=1 Tax=Fodinibius roseus TaxID=1194090 RepID=A0A1M5LVN7_9BACT|nr:NAD-dependent succinate-semialdehyde dehydrogenase [Fodinibius roseus]SHG69117.1 succinate semialdehyde dehydrogenase [Fodinibius roseus]
MKTYPLFLNNQWVMSDEAIGIINPASSDVFAKMSTVDRKGVAKALDDAQVAFQGWRKLTGKKRGEYLEKIADELEQQSEEIARIITCENGKPLAQSSGEVAMSVDHLRWFAGEARRTYGRTVPHQDEGKRHIITKTPVGVTAAISPWNFPLVLALRKIAPALAAGCPVILKPSSQTPICAVALAKCVEKAGLPQGVFQLVAGSASEISQEFLDNPICKKITFTGSTEVGRILIKGAAVSIKPLSLELGGHAPFIVFEDADLEVAVEGAMITKFRNTGQSCIASNRIYVQSSIYSDFLELFVEKTRALKIGGGLEDNVDIGPLFNEEGLTKAIEHIENAVSSGAELKCGGEQIDREGYFLKPTILADVPSDADCMTEETFAPIAPVSSFDSESEVIEKANDTHYGLCAYAYTRDVSRSFRLMESLEAGTIGLNDAVPSTSQCPFGGFKQSGWGRELGSEGVEAFLETKHVSLGLEI